MVSIATEEEEKICDLLLLVLRSTKLGQWREVMKPSQTIFVTRSFVWWVRRLVCVCVRACAREREGERDERCSIFSLG